MSLLVQGSLYVVTYMLSHTGRSHNNVGWHTRKHPIEEEVGDVEQTLIFILQLINQSIGGKAGNSMDTPISIRIIIYYDL